MNRQYLLGDALLGKSGALDISSSAQAPRKSAAKNTKATTARVISRNGWSYYLTAPEVAFEVVVRLVAAALAGLSSTDRAWPLPGVCAV